MASIWQFASTRGLISLADAQSADPEELQVFDIFLAMKSFVRAPGRNAPRLTESSLQMTPSQCLYHAQQSNIQSRIPVIASQSKLRQATLV